MATTTKGTQQKRRSKGDGSIFPNKRGGWTARYRKKGLPDKEFNARTKGEAKKLLDEWKVLVAIEDAVTTNIKIDQFAKKYMFRKELAVEAKKLKQSSLDRIERTYTNHLKGTDAFNKTFANLTAEDITATIRAKKDELSYSSLKKIYLFWSGMIHHAMDTGELPSNYDKILKTVEIPAEDELEIETKEIMVITPEHQKIIKQIAMEPSPNRNERYLYRYGPAIVFLLNTGLRGGELLALGKSKIIPYQKRKGIKIERTLSRVKNRETDAKNKTDILSTQNEIFPTIQNLANTLKKICKRAGLPLYNLHTLRHTFATNLIRNTQSMGYLKEATELLGDSCGVVINTYFHTDSEKKAELIDSLDQAA